MRLKVLCDENVPGAVIGFLNELGFDVRTAKPGSLDTAIAAQARREKRILITFDSDFANILAYPPSHFFGIIRVKVSPPFIDVILRSLKTVFKQFRTQKEFRGKLVIAESDRFRVWET